MRTRTSTTPGSRQPARAARPRHGTVGGFLLMVAGGAILMGIITAEALYPAAYSTHRNTVSDLAAMRPDNLVRQPSAAIFNWTMIVTGVLVIISAYCLHRGLQRWAISIPATLLGVGILGVGIFPGTHMTEHQLFATLAFVAGSISAMLSWYVLRGPLRYLSVVLGAVALTSLVVGISFMDWAPAAHLGEGGIERWIAYPVVLWMVAFGAWLTGRPALPQANRTRPHPETGRAALFAAASGNHTLTPEAEVAGGDRHAQGAGVHLGGGTALGKLRQGDEAAATTRGAKHPAPWRGPMPGRPSARQHI